MIRAGLGHGILTRGLAFRPMYLSEYPNESTLRTRDKGRKSIVLIAHTRPFAFQLNIAPYALKRNGFLIDRCTFDLTGKLRSRTC